MRPRTTWLVALAIPSTFCLAQQNDEYSVFRFDKTAFIELDLEAQLAHRMTKSFIWDTLREGTQRLSNVRIFAQRSETHQLDDRGEVKSGANHVTALITVGDELSGHPSLVHGGFTAAILDDLFGWAAAMEKNSIFPNSQTKIFTANLDVNYRKPMKDCSAYMVDIHVEKVVRQKKVYLTATVTDTEGRVCVESTALYIIKASST